MANATITYQLTTPKADGTRGVRLRLSYKRESKYYRTSLIVHKDDVTAGGKFRNWVLRNQVDDLLRFYRDRLNTMNLDINDTDIDYIYHFLFEHKAQSSYDFIAWAEDWCEKHKHINGVRSSYKPALNKFKAFKGNVVMTYEMTTKTMKAFEESLADTKRAKSLYTSLIKKLFNDMCDEYNDYDMDDIVIKNTMRSYTPPKQQKAEQRALTLDEVKRVLACPYDNRKWNGMPSLHDLALDCFKISFFVMGINSVDLHNLTEYDGEKIHYYRTKTRDRRDDDAEMEVVIHDVVKPLINKYIDIPNQMYNKTVRKASQKKPAFRFFRRHADSADFNKAINKGLKEVGKECGIDDLEFYAARHTLATLAANDANINPYRVSDMLCHIESKLAVTNVYIKRNFEPMNQANADFIEWFLNQ